MVTFLSVASVLDKKNMGKVLVEANFRLEMDPLMA